MDKKCIHVWLGEEYYKTLVEYAGENKRSISNAAEFLLERAIRDGSIRQRND